ncbi:MAG: hypothetical protein AAF787_00050 [Chloroflexota bacterium]
MSKHYVVIRWGKKRGDVEGAAVFHDLNQAVNYWQQTIRGGYGAAITFAENDPQPPAPKPVQMKMFESVE